MSKKKKPCPFCGKSGVIEKLENGQYYPRCSGGSPCLLSRTPNIEEDGYISEEYAIKLWNMRPTVRFYDV